MQIAKSNEKSQPTGGHVEELWPKINSEKIRVKIGFWLKVTITSFINP